MRKNKVFTIRRLRRIGCFLLVGVMLASLPGCSVLPRLLKRKPNINYDQTAGKTALSYGDLMQQDYQIVIAQDSLSQDTGFRFQKPEKVKKPSQKEGAPIGIPVEINMDDPVSRLEKPATVTLKVGENDLQEVNFLSDLRIGYYDGRRWHYEPITSFDKASRTVTFTTYHFSLFWTVKPTREMRLAEVAHKMAVQNWAQKNSLEGSREELEKMVDEMTKNQFGAVDKSLTQDVVEAIVSENSIGKYLLMGRDLAQSSEEDKSRYDAIAKEVAVQVGKQIFKKISEDEAYVGIREGYLAKALDATTENADQIDTTATAATELLNNGAEAAAKVVANAIVGSTGVGKVLLTGVTVIDRQINRWKSNELENAYKVYINGSESWGYSVEKGDFQELWSQTRGLSHKIYSDAMETYRIKNGLTTDQMDKLDKRTKDDIRLYAKVETRKMFEQRKEREEALKKEVKLNMEYITNLETANLLTPVSFGYDESKMSLEDRLDQLFKIRMRIEAELGKEMRLKGGAEGEFIPVKHIIILTQALTNASNETNPEEAYQKALVELGYQSQQKFADSLDGELFKENPKLPDLSGTWKGTMTETTYYLEDGSSDSPEVWKWNLVITKNETVDRKNVAIKYRNAGIYDVMISMKHPDMEETEPEHWDMFLTEDYVLSFNGILRKLVETDRGWAIQEQYHPDFEEGYGYKVWQDWIAYRVD